jgi:hypothetical protein
MMLLDYHSGFLNDNYWNFGFAFHIDLAIIQYSPKNTEVLEVVNKTIEASEHFSNVETLIEVIDSFDMTGVNMASQSPY